MPKLAQLVQNMQDNEQSACEWLLAFDGDLFYPEAFTTKRMKEEYPEVAAAFSSKTLTMKFAHAVAEEARSLAGVEGDKFPLPGEARAATLKRLAKRHCGKGKEEAAQRLATELAAWAEGKNKDDKKPLGIEEIAQWILLARFIAGGGRDEE